MTALLRLRQYLRYDPETGHIVWLVKRTKNATANVGDLAGGVDNNGYRRLMFDGKKYRHHRLAFVLMGQEMPEQVDHINGNRLDNRWINLRVADSKINAKNASRRKNSQTILTGVSFSKQHSKWKVRVNHDSQTEYLGLFDNVFDAAAARISRQNAYAYSDRHGKAAP